MKKNLFNFKIAVVLLGVFFATSASAFTAVVSGNWSNPATWGGVAPTANVSNQDIIIPLGITVILDQDVTFSGALNSFTVDGALFGLTTDGVDISAGTLAGAGVISIDHLDFSGALSSASFTGDINVKELTNSASALGITGVVVIQDTLDLESGNLQLNTNGTITMLSNSTIKVNTGSIIVNGGIFNLTNAYNVMYVGTAKTAGIELNSVTLQHLYLNMDNNIEVVSLSGNATVNGSVNFSLGKLSLNGTELTFMGDLMMATGTSIISTTTSSLIIEGTGALSSTLMFAAGASINNFVINRTLGGLVKLGSSLNINGYLRLMDGTLRLDSLSNMTMNNSSVIHVEKGMIAMNTGLFNGNAAYNVEYMGLIGSGMTAGIELTGTGLNNVTVNYPDTNSVTLSDTTTINGDLNLINGNLLLAGKTLILNGTLSQTSSGRLSGSAASDLQLNLTSVTNDTLYFNQGLGLNMLNKLKINTLGPNAIVLGSQIKIQTELSFVSGKLDIDKSDLTIAPTATITGYDDMKYIVTSGDTSGALIMNVISGSAYVTYPVGTSDNYSPAYIQQSAGASTGDFSVRTMNKVLSNGTYGFESSSVLKVVDRTWFIHSDVPTINTNLKLGWMVTSELNGFNRTNAYIGHYTSSWDMVAASSASTGTNNTFELSRTGITSLSPFAVIEAGQPIKLNEIAVGNDFDVYPNPSKDVVNIKTSNFSDDYKYELVDITGRTLRTSQGKNFNKFDVVNLEAGCYFIKATNLTTNKIATKRFIKE